jgi:hypothetical protein
MDYDIARAWSEVLQSKIDVLQTVCSGLSTYEKECPHLLSKVDVMTVASQVESAIQILKMAQPNMRCPFCSGGCNACHDTGYTSASRSHQVPKEFEDGTP